MDDKSKRRQLIAGWGSKVRTPKGSKRVQGVPEKDPGADDELAPVLARIDFDQGRASEGDGLPAREPPNKSESASGSCGKRNS